MDGRCVGQHQFIQFRDIVGDISAIKIDSKSTVLGVHEADDPYVAVEYLFVIVVADLHDLVPLPELHAGMAEKWDGIRSAVSK